MHTQTHAHTDRYYGLVCCVQLVQAADVGLCIMTLGLMIIQLMCAFASGPHTLGLAACTPRCMEGERNKKSL